jgi:hypothetical protein
MLDAPIRRIITGGAVLEDQSRRALHHFFDPVHGGRGLTVESSVFSHQAGRPSPDWILEVSGDGVELEISSQDFSYRDALGYFYHALTGEDEAGRDVNFGLMFRGLGHVIHHIQDMAQPQHVRNDQHCDVSANLVCALANNPSHYEKYTDQFRDTIVVNTSVYGVPYFPGARDFWGNTQGSGMAEFTVANFISQGTNFALNSLGELSPHPSYPLPGPFQENSSFANDLSSVLQEAKVNPGEIIRIMQGLDCNQPLVCEVDFISNNVIDHGQPGSQGITVNHRASSISLLSDELTTRDLRGGITTTYNRLNFHAAYPYLISRAVAYSAGLIDHFFRGRLGIDSAEKDGNRITLTITNRSTDNQTFHGDGFELYYDSTNGERNQIEELTVIDGGLPLGTSGNIQLAATLPQDVDMSEERPFMLVFNGNRVDTRIGQDRGIAAINFAAEEDSSGNSYFFALLNPRVFTSLESCVSEALLPEFEITVASTIVQAQNSGPNGWDAELTQELTKIASSHFFEQPSVAGRSALYGERHNYEGIITLFDKHQNIRTGSKDTFRITSFCAESTCVDPGLPCNFDAQYEDLVN